MILKKSTFLIVALTITAAFISCKKIEESIKRDIIITPAGTEFTIPKIPTTNAGSVAGDFTASIDLNKEIQAITPEFGAGNIQNLKITALKLELLDTPLLEDNNLGNIENIRIEISANGKKDTLANYLGNPSTNSLGISIPVKVSAAYIKEILDASSFKYAVIVKLRKAITEELKAKLTPVYTATVAF